MNTTKKLLLLALPLSLALGCAGDDNSDESFRMLPVAATMPDGSEVFVGTYDESTQEIELVSAFVAEIDDAAEGTLSLASDGLHQPLAAVVTWGDDLEVGSRMAIVDQRDEKFSVGSTLVVHDEAWTDGLTEAEAASSFPTCWDPEPIPCVVEDGPRPKEPQPIELSEWGCYAEDELPSA